MNLESVLSLQRPQLQQWCLWGEDKGKLGYLYEIPKFHKVPTGHRFIAGCSEVSTTLLARLLVKVLNFILMELREKDNDLIRDCGVRRYFVLDNFEELTAFLAKWSPHRFNSVRTGDFSTLYTAIPLDDLVRVLKGVVSEIWKHKANQEQVTIARVFILVEDDVVGWCFRGSRSYHSKKKHVLSMARLVDMLCFLIRNTYLENGGVIYKQIIGIPMGTNPGPSIANLYLYGYESSYIDTHFLNARVGETHAERNMRLEEGKRFHMSFRYIDDTLSFDNERWGTDTAKSLEAGGIYPHWLTFNDTSFPDCLSGKFLGLNISISEKKKVSVNVYDKRKDFPFPVQRYPNMQSFIPKTMVYATFLTVLDRVYKICTIPKNFLFHASEIAKTMIEKGCMLNRLVSLFIRFFEKRGFKLKWKQTQYRKLLGTFKNFCNRQ